MYAAVQNQAYLPPPVEEHLASYKHSAVPLSNAKLAELAKKFADSIPDEEFSVAALQGYLLKNKSRPEAAADGAPAWVISERELKEKLRKEKEARELKEKEEREKRRLEAEKEKRAELEKLLDERKAEEEKKVESETTPAPSSVPAPPAQEEQKAVDSALTLVPVAITSPTPAEEENKESSGFSLFGDIPSGTFPDSPQAASWVSVMGDAKAQA